LGVISKTDTREAKLAKVRAMTEKQTFDSLAETQDKAETDADKMLKAAEEQGKRTQSISDKLEVIIDGLFNYLYKVLMGIWDTISDMSPFGSSDESKRQRQEMKDQAAIKDRDRRLSSDIEKAKTELSSATTPEQKKQAEDKIKGLVDLQDIYAGKQTFHPQGNGPQPIGPAGPALGVYSPEPSVDQDQGYGPPLPPGGIPADQNYGPPPPPGGIPVNQGYGPVGGTPQPQGYGPMTGAASTSMGAPSASAMVGTAPAAPTKGDELVAQTVAQGHDQIVDAQKEIHDDNRKRGIKLDKPREAFADATEKSVFNATEKALFEYAMYTAPDVTKLMERIGASGLGGPQNLAKEWLSQGAFSADKIGSPDALKAALGVNAQGGEVLNTMGGLAQIRSYAASQGEGLALVGKGERILPAGGGGGPSQINLNVNGIGGSDLANFLRDKMAAAIYEYKRRESFH
jgi:hypothetical protein